MRPVIYVHIPAAEPQKARDARPRAQARLCLCHFRPLPACGCILSLLSRLSFSSRTRATPVSRRRPTLSTPSTPERTTLTKHIVPKLRKLQTQPLELGLRLAPQHMRPRSPELRHRRPDPLIPGLRVPVHVPRVLNLPLGRRVDAVDLAARERPELGEAELAREGVDARVAEELGAVVVDGGDGGVRLEGSLAGELAGEVVARVEVFEEAADAVDVFLCEVDVAGLYFVSLPSVRGAEEREAPQYLNERKRRRGCVYDWGKARKDSRSHHLQTSHRHP